MWATKWTMPKSLQKASKINAVLVPLMKFVANIQTTTT